MTGDRSTQPHRRGVGRQQTGALSAMMAGEPANAPNPMDAQRAFQTMPAGAKGPPVSQILLDLEARARAGEIKSF